MSSINKQTKYIMEFVSKFLENLSEEKDTKGQWMEQEEDLKKLLKRLGKHRDPNHPKHPKTSYIFFCEMKREDVKQAMLNKLNEDAEEQVEKVDPKNVTRELSEKWNQLKDKAPYEEMAKKDKERYDAEMADYSPPEDNDEEDEKPKRKKRI